MLRARDTLIIGGEASDPPTGKTDAEEESEQEKRGSLCLVSDSDGREMGVVQLRSSPVWDGMAAADGRLYIATTSGRIVCLE